MNARSSESPGYCFGIRVKTKAPAEGITGMIGGLYRVAVKEAPEKGKANKRICKILAELFCVSRSRVSIISGQTSRDKTVCVEGVSPEEAEQKLADAV